MNKEQARQAIEAHEAAAIRNPRKAHQHHIAAQILREQFSIPLPFTFGDKAANRREIQRAEHDRINKWKESR